MFSDSDNFLLHHRRVFISYSHLLKFIQFLLYVQCRKKTKAKKKAKKANATTDFRTGDVTNLDGISGPYDLALDMGCFHGVKDRGAYLTELKRILSPGGFWLMYGIFNPGLISTRPGLIPSDLDIIQSYGFELLTRKDGTDKRDRPSAWFLYKKS